MRGHGTGMGMPGSEPTFKDFSRGGLRPSDTYTLATSIAELQFVSAG